MALLNARQIREIFVEKSSIFNRLYYGDNGIVYKGIKGGDLMVWEDRDQVSNIINQTIQAVNSNPSLLPGSGGLTQSQVANISQFRL